MKCPDCHKPLIDVDGMEIVVGRYYVTPIRWCFWCRPKLDDDAELRMAAMRHIICNSVQEVLAPTFLGEVGGYEVRDAIQAYGWKQPAFAERIGVSPEVLGAWLTQDTLPREVIDMVRDNLRGAPPPVVREKQPQPESGANSELLRLRDELRRWHK